MNWGYGLARKGKTESTRGSLTVARRPPSLRASKTIAPPCDLVTTSAIERPKTVAVAPLATVRLPGPPAEPLEETLNLIGRNHRTAVLDLDD